MSVRVLTDEERRSGLGGTDIAAWVGVSTYRAPIDVYLEKRGEAPPQEPSWRMRMGQLLEDAIADAYAESTGRKLARVGTVWHKRHPFLYVHCDRRVVGEPGLVECKATSHPGQYADGPPPAVRVQAQWQMALTGRLWVDVVVLSGPSGIDPHRVERDQALIDDLVAAGVQAWEQHVVPGTPPEVDGTEAYRRYLASRYPRALVDERVATAEQVLLIDELRAATDAAKAAEQHKDLVENRLREAIGDAGRLLAPQATVTLREQAPSVSWKAVAERLADRHAEDLDALRAEDTEGKAGTRVMRVSWKKEEG